MKMLSILIPTRSNPICLKRCLDSLYKALRKISFKTEIIILDGTYEEEVTVDLLKKINISNLFWSPVEQWWGFSHIINHGVSLAKGDTFLILNDDCFVSPNFLEIIGKNLAPNPENIYGFLLTRDGMVQHAGQILPESSYPTHRALNLEVQYLNVPPQERIASVSFACTVISRAIWEKLGGLDQEFKFGWEDCDFCLRGWEAGIETILINFVQNEHIGGASAGLMYSLSPRFGIERNFPIFRFKWPQERLQRLRGVIEDAKRHRDGLCNTRTNKRKAVG